MFLGLSSELVLASVALICCHNPDMRLLTCEGYTVLTASQMLVSTHAGGRQSVPKASFGGGCLIGCSGGFLNVPKIKGTHMAMKTGILAAEAAFGEIAMSQGSREPLHMNGYQRQLDMSWVMFELDAVRISMGLHALHVCELLYSLPLCPRICMICCNRCLMQLPCVPVGEEHPPRFQVGYAARSCKCSDGDICLPLAVGRTTLDSSSQRPRQ